MTYSLDTLNSRNAPAAGTPGGVKRFAHEVSLILGLLGLVFWLAALLSYTPQDVAWSTSGSADLAAGAQAITHNFGGRFGAWLADASYFLLGFSVWWALVAGVRADGEVMLDIEIAAAVAPGANIVVHFAANSDQGFIDAISTAVHDPASKPGVISISWGAPESSWTQQSMTALNQACQSSAALGITITVAAGDNGSTDGVTDGANHVDFPSSSSHVLARGGTKLIGSHSAITSEVVWNETANNEGATGGGVSSVFSRPT